MAIFERQTTGSVVCTSCGKLVGAKDEVCWHCGRRNPALWGFAPLLRRWGQDLGFVRLVIGGCAGLYLVSLMLDLTWMFESRGIFGLLSPSPGSVFLLGASGGVPVFGLGRWWTVLSAAWLHGGLLHIVFNMLWVRQLVPVVAELYGPGRMVVIYTVSSVVGALTSSCVGAYLPWLPWFLGGAGLTIGASGAIFGLLGAVVYFGRRGGSRAAGGWAWSYAVALFVFGLLWPGVDNWGHAGGFVGGYAMSRWLDPLRPERIDHLVAALVCLVLTALAIVASVVHSLLFLRS